MAATIVSIVVTTNASAADAGPDSGITDSGVSTVPSEGGKLALDAGTTSSSGDPAPSAGDDDGGCALSAPGAGGGDGWAAIGLFATVAAGVISRARRRNR
ncbi:MAG: hypothetical protein JST00_33040 [Deltaproteobacteria bacterium]|nr:hypothetical protein [Deltaproteobacteria bacterium]